MSWAEFSKMGGWGVVGLGVVIAGGIISILSFLLSLLDFDLWGRVWWDWTGIIFGIIVVFLGVLILLVA